MEFTRDNTWLTNRLRFLHHNHFPDVPIKNTVLVRFGRITKTRLGSITKKPKKGFSEPVTLITINGLLRHPTVPEYVIDAVLAHEFVHYTHGFHSPLPRLYRYPHQAGIVDQEMIKRGFKDDLANEKRWTKNHFAKLYKSQI